MAPSRPLDRAFHISITLKGIDGALETAGGLVLLVVSPSSLHALARTLTQHELSQDPHDFIAHHILRATGNLSHHTTLFAAVYLLSHGLAKVALVIALLRDQLWAYPAMIALLVAFIAYQLYRLHIHATIGLTLLTLFDALVAWLTWREYQTKHTPLAH